MISENHNQNIRREKIRKIFTRFLTPVVFTSCFIISFYFGFEYSEKTALFNDKLIDVSSIFFGIFLGCLGLFEKFRNDNTYLSFLSFSRRLLFYNIFLIAFSFIIMLMSEIQTNSFKLNLKGYTIILKPNVIVFSIYVSSFAAVIVNIIRFVKIILIILKSRRNSQ